jgi:hypothetical protein
MDMVQEDGIWGNRERKEKKKARDLCLFGF